MYKKLAIAAAAILILSIVGAILVRTQNSTTAEPAVAVAKVEKLTPRAWCKQQGIADYKSWQSPDSDCAAAFLQTHPDETINFKEANADEDAEGEDAVDDITPTDDEPLPGESADDGGNGSDNGPVDGTPTEQGQPTDDAGSDSGNNDEPRILNL